MVSLALWCALLARPARALDDGITVDMEGYYRVRGVFLPGMYADQRSSGPLDLFSADNGDGRMLVQRLRLQPEFSAGDKAHLFIQADALDDVVWGDNESLASTALFAGDPSTTGMDGHAGDTFRVKRAWVEFMTPVGLVRAGRQPSNWGLGLLANGGDGFDDTFGDNHYGSTYDRLIFATRPLAIAGAAAGKESWGEVPLYLAVGVDRLVEDPLIQYYGYTCSRTDPAGDPIVEGSEDYDPRCDPDGQGYHTIEHDYTEPRADDDRGQDWWIDQNDDVMEMIYVLVYKGEGVRLGGEEGDLMGGVYVVNRTQRETDSDIWIYDAWAKLAWKGIYLEGEALTIRGETSAIALPGTYDPSGATDDPLYKKADIWGYAARAGYERPGWSAVFETGYASGDDDAADADFTGRALHPDYNVGLLLYEEVMARVTAITWTDAADGLWSKGGVVNSRYVFPTFTARPLPGNEVILGVLGAWPDVPDGSRILCREGDEKGGEAVQCSSYDAEDAMLGWEVDLAVKQRFDEHMQATLEGGYARTTDRIPVANLGLNPDGRFWTVQSRLAWEF